MYIKELGTYKTRSGEVVEIDLVVGSTAYRVGKAEGTYKTGPRAGTRSVWMITGFHRETSDRRRDIVECIQEKDEEGVALNAT